ncbi:MAG TPA: cysteine hydrolase [Candidatus Latescibacteria bacterium]|nr:cysteine hydrolase [Candidatus Latescibacterota bacterium]
MPGGAGGRRYREFEHVGQWAGQRHPEESEKPDLLRPSRGGADFLLLNQRGPGLRHISAAYIRVLMNLGHDTEEKLHEVCGSKDDEVAVNSHLDPQPEDFVLPKRRGDAFQDAGFELLLRTLQRETLVLVGCSTDWCLEATAWAATNKDYYVVVAEDCTRSPRPDGHEAALIQFRTIGLDVVNSQELTELWQHL